MSSLPESPPGVEPAFVVFVCTANQCRSPMAEALLRARLAKIGLAETVAVGSAGVMAGGRHATEDAARVVADLGGDLTHHVPRPLTPDLLDAADLIVAMAREHAREAIVLRPDTADRVFTLRDLIRRVEAEGRRHSTESLPAYVSRIGTGRDPAHLLGRSRTDDIVDPIGRPLDEYRKTAGQLDDLIGRLVAALWPA